MATGTLKTYKDKLLLCLAEDEDFTERDFQELVWKQKEDADRIDLVYKNLLKYDIFEDAFKADAKSDCRTSILLHQRYQLIRAGKYHDALINCTKATMVAASQQHLSRAYAARSEILFQLQLYEECIVDVDRALAYNIEEWRAYLLFLRKDRAVDFLRNRRRPKPYEDTLESAVKQRIPWKKWARMIEIQEGEDRNCVVATGDIQVGEVVGLELPEAVGITKEGYFFYCHHCFKLCYNPIPCDRCTQTLYCSLDCKNDAFANYHSEECAVLYSLVLFSEQPEDKVVALDIKAAPVTYSPDTFFNMTVIGAAVYGLVRQHTKVFRPPDRELTAQIFKNFIIKYLLYCRQYLLRINETKLADDSTQEVITDSFACGIYPLGTSFRHSCCPNVYAAYCCGVTLVLVAIRSIKRGEECFISYGPMYTSLSLEKRQGMLLSQMGFKCQCRACEENWPQFDAISTNLKSSFVDFRQQYALTVIKNNESIKIATDMLVIMIRGLQAAGSYNDLHFETYKLVCYYAALGNKRLFEYSCGQTE